jgi:putative endonuclease
VGCAHNVGARILQHNAGNVKATRGGAPWTLLHSEAIGACVLALRRERYYKSGAGRRRLAAWFAGGLMDATMAGTAGSNPALSANRRFRISPRAASPAGTGA